MQSSRNTQLDGLRGFAAVTVAIYHSMLGLDFSQIERVLQPTFWRMRDAGAYDVVSKGIYTVLNGETAVLIFFVLSGTVLFRSLLDQSAEPPLPLALKFGLKRVLRIYPALIVCLVGYILVAATINAHVAGVFPS